MKELYFINLIGNLQGVAIAICVISGCFIVLGVPFLMLVLDDLFIDEEKQKQIFRKSVKSCIITLALSLILLVFLPSRKDMYIIYRVGETIDWVKGKEKAEQLPDKAVEALDAFLDDYCKKQEKQTK